jgi:hypothetical protein
MISTLIGIYLLLIVCYPLYPAYKGFKNNRTYNYRLEQDCVYYNTRTENTVSSYIESLGFCGLFGFLFALVVSTFYFSFMLIFGL